jgi:hypothetical protein
VHPCFLGDLLVLNNLLEQTTKGGADRWRKLRSPIWPSESVAKASFWAFSTG